MRDTNSAAVGPAGIEQIWSLSTEIETEIGQIGADVDTTVMRIRPDWVRNSPTWLGNGTKWPGVDDQMWSNWRDFPASSAPLSATSVDPVVGAAEGNSASAP